MVTKDDTIVIHYKDYGTPKCRVKKFATNLELLGLSQQVPIDQSLVWEYHPMSQILMRPTFSRLFFIVVFEYGG